MDCKHDRVKESRVSESLAVHIHNMEDYQEYECLNRNCRLVLCLYDGCEPQRASGWYRVALE